MATVEITFERALRIWWSYTWRSVVLALPVVFLMVYFLPPPAVPDSGAAIGAGIADPMAGSQGNLLLRIFIMALIIVTQVQALRWMLKTKWRDFRLHAVSDEGGSTP